MIPIRRWLDCFPIRFRQRRLFGASAALGLLLSVCPSQAQSGAGDDVIDPATSLVESFEHGELSFSFNARYEQVDQDSFAEDATAFTLRTTLGFATKTWRHLQLHVGAEDASVIGSGETFANRGIGSTNNGVIDRPVIADVEGTEINQLTLGYTGIANTLLRAGRTELALDDQRFLGPVGWRQNHQEFDLFQVRTQPSEAWTVQYVYLDQVHNIFRGRDPMNSHLINLAFEPSAKKPAGKLVGYAYLLDYDEPSRFALSSATYGARWTAKKSLGGGAVSWTVELAKQVEHGDNPADFDLGYRHLEAGYGPAYFQVQIGYELLEGNGANSFRTPLATLHKFNGWADLFLVTPLDGLQDVYASIGGKRDALSWVVVYHQFNSDVGGRELGSELDAQWVYTTSWRQQLGIKLARYEAQDFATDTTKLWVFTTWGF